MFRIVLEEDGERRRHAPAQAVVRIGRDAGNDVVVRSPFVSSRHGELRQDGAGVWYEDLVSTNGSRVARRGEVLSVDASRGLRILLEEGDELLLGDRRHPVRLRVETAQDAPPRERDDDDAEPRSGRPVAFDAAGHEVLRLIGAGLPRESLLALHQIAIRMGGPRAVGEVLPVLAEGALEMVPGASTFTAWLRDDATGRLVAAHCRTRALAAEAPPLPTELRRRVFAQGTAMTFVAAEAHRGSSVGLAAPLWDGRDVIGIVTLSGAGTGAPPLGARELELLALLAHQAALVLSLALRLERVPAAR